MATRRAFGKTWWGNTWVEAMEKIDYNTNRLPRGKRYANTGMVKEIKIKDGDVLARVQGTRPSPYKIKISLKKFNEAQVRKIKSIVSGDPVLASELTLGKLPEEMLAILEKQKIYLLPTAWSDLSANCSCPDWANPCKHLAAVYYIIANEIDKDPFIIFNLRGISTSELMEAAGFAPEADQDVKRDFFIPYTEVPTETKALTKTSERVFEPSLWFQKTELTAIFALLSNAPLFYREGDFKKILFKAYQNIADSLEELPLLEEHLPFKEVNLCLLYPPKKTFFSLAKVSFFAFPEDKLPELCHGEGKSMSIPGQAGEKLVMKKHKGKIIQAGALLDLFLRLPLNTSLNDYSPSARFLNVAAAVAQALARSASFAPEVTRDAEGNFFVRYIPLIHAEETATMIDYLASIMPVNFIFREADKSLLTGKNAVCEIISLILSHIVSNFANIDQEDKLCNAFFKGAPYIAEGFEEKQTAKSISGWLGRLHLRARDISPVIRIELPGEENGFKLHIDVENKQEPLAPLLPLAQVFSAKGEVFSRPAEVVRSEVAKQITIASEYMPELKEILSSRGKKTLRLDPLVMAEFLDSVKEAFNLLGIRVSIPKELKKLATPRIAITAKSKGERISYLSLDQMLSFSWEVAIGDLTLTKEEFLKLASSAQGIVKFKDQYLLLRPDEVKSILHQLNKPLPKLSSRELLQASLTDEVQGVLFNPDAVMKRLLEELTKIEEVKVPDSLKANLRPYQERGFQWLYTNLTKGLGCCLADDMGLGKTVQVIALLLKLKEDAWLDAPTLVICPTTLIGNWVKECAKFAPSLKVSIYHGTERQLRTSRTDILLTTYGVIRRDLQKFKEKAWSIVVIDEAQNIKNHDSEQTRAVKSLQAKGYIAMSGTPVENRLTELWSIFDFINRGYFGTLADFVRRFAIPIEKYRDKGRIAMLRKATAPFILRRLKTDKSIIKDLPDKAVFNEYCYLTKEQAAMYQQVIDTIMKEITSSEGMARRGLIFKLLTSLKQICNHPLHYTKRGKVSKEHSGKAQKAISLLEKIVAAGEKALLFTQYREMGELLEEMIAQELGKEPLFFHGGLPRTKRDKMVEDFQNNTRYPVMVISLKAGGTGLNLTAATNVIHYDLWWNPAVEAQATDRTYRIGQTQKVVVYRLITLGTFEERIDEMLNSKKELAELTVSTGEQWITELSDKELLEIFRLAR